MSEKIFLTLNVQVIGGPKISESKTIEVEAYDVIDVIIPANSSAKDIHIQPGDINQVLFLLIRPDYGPALINENEYVTYTVNTAKEPDPTIPEFALDTWQLFIGDGALKLFGYVPHVFYFYNNSDKDVPVLILVGRRATTKKNQ